MSIRSLYILASVVGKSCDFCKAEDTCYFYIDVETHKEVSFVLCRGCFHLKPRCIDCDGYIYRREEVCSDIDPNEGYFNDRCEPCTNKRREQYEPGSSGPLEESWGNLSHQIIKEDDKKLGKTEE